MTDDALLRNSLAAIEVNDTFSEAAVTMTDASRLCFCHRVGQRWARAQGADGADGPTSLAGRVLARMTLFRLNAKHLDIQFADGSRWEAAFGRPRQTPGSQARETAP
jgi:hypothetical protein